MLLRKDSQGCSLHKGLHCIGTPNIRSKTNPGTWVIRARQRRRNPRSSILSCSSVYYNRINTHPWGDFQTRFPPKHAHTHTQTQMVANMSWRRLHRRIARRTQYALCLPRCREIRLPKSSEGCVLRYHPITEDHIK